MNACIIYAAKSTEDKHGSIPTQLEHCRALAQREGWSVEGEYRDEAASAYKGNRGAGLAQAKAHAEQLKAVLVVDHTDRLARGDGVTADHLVEVLLWARKAGVTIASVKDPATCQTGLAFAAMMGDRNHEDSRRKSLAVRDGMERRAKKGLLNGGPRPYGYRWEGPRGEKQLLVVPGEAEVVRRIFRDYAAGKSQKAITRELDAEGIKTATGKPWHQGTVAAILANPTYKGLVRFGGETHPGVHEPLVDADLWAAVEALRNATARTRGAGRGRTPKGPHLFVKGLLRCGSCGEAMVPRTSPSTGRICHTTAIGADEYAEAQRHLAAGKSVAAAAKAIGRSKAGLSDALKRGGPTERGTRSETYVCYGRIKNGPGFCNQAPVRRADIDSAVFAHFQETKLDLDAMRARVEASTAAKVDEISALRRQAEAEAQRADERLARVRRDYTDGKIDAADWKAFRDDLTGEAEAARGQAEQLARRQEEAERAVGDLTEDQALQELTALRAAIAGHISGAAGVDEIRAKLKTLGDRWTLTSAHGQLVVHMESVNDDLLKRTSLSVDRLSRVIADWNPHQHRENKDAVGFPTASKSLSLEELLCEPIPVGTGERG